MSRGTILGAALLVAAMGAWRARAPAPRGASLPRPEAAAPAGTDAVRGAAAGAASGGSSPATTSGVRRARSLVGTRPDGALETSPDGRLRASAATRLFFEYFLTATGEVPPAGIRTRIVAAIQRRLPPAAAAEAVALLDRFLAYRERARQLAADGLDEAPLEERLESLVRLRRETLGVADAEALFGEEEARDRSALARRHALIDPALSPEARTAALADADAIAPEAVRRANAAATLPMRLAADETALRAAGGSDEEVQRLREAAVGADAAARLAALDRERAAWAMRLEDYRVARAAIDADTRRSDAERARARAVLLATRFTPKEQLRVQAAGR